LENYKFRRQHPICGYILDFYCQEIRLGIEVDGEVHQTQEQIAYDNQRSIDLSEIGIKVIRFRNSEVIRSVDEVLQQILLSLECKSKQ
jgi:very-short-patch-repair endonuclease